MEHVDVVIVGGGMVGLVLACGLQGSGLRVAVLEQHVPEHVTVNTHSILHVSDINVVSEKLLRRLGVWSDIIASRISCYHGIEVWDKDSFGRITFDSEILGYGHLGHIIENTIIHAALWQKAQLCGDVMLVAPVQLQQVVWGENESFLILENGEVITTQLMVGADGSNSWLRNKAEIPLTFWDYRHHALIATIRTAEPHEGLVRHVFHSNGILAFLPLSDPNLCSIIWLLTPDSAQQMSESKPEIFNQTLYMEFDGRLGLCSVESECQTFPLSGHYARRFVAHRLVLVGDAAYTIHSLAGQGVNLGFMDAAVLVGELRRLHDEGKDIGQHLYLRRYERSRKYSVAIALAGIHGFRELFAGKHQVKKLVRGIGLKLADIIPGVKMQLLCQVMGLNDLPDWLR